MPEISVIVPVYKAEAFLADCIDSILSQSFSDFEIILVDDGSPDNSGRICEEYAAKYACIRVLHQEAQLPVIEVPMKMDENYRFTLDFEALEAAFIAALIPSTVTSSPLTTATKIVVDPVGTGTR